MRPLALGQPITEQDYAWILQALRTIENASHEDAEGVFDAFALNSTSFTPTRTLNVTAPTLANAVAFVATLITDLKRRGQTRA